VLPNTNPTTSQNDTGSVAVLIGNPQNLNAPTATAIALQQHLTAKAPIISRVWVSILDYQPLVIRVYGSYEPGLVAQDLADDLFDIIQEQLTTNPRQLTDRDLTVLGDRVGFRVVASTLNGNNAASVNSLRSALYLKYLEVQLTPSNSDMLRGDDTRLLWGSESGELFIYGQGDED
jgi:hypothetical protein